MAISIDWGTKVISVPQSYLTLISGTLYNLDTNQFRLDLRALEASDEGMAFPKTHNHNTTVTLSGIDYSRVVEIINGYTIEFENGSYAVNLDGSNNNILDVAVRNNVSVGANNSAGLIGLQNLEAASYNGQITVDTINGETGTAYPIGTLNRPVNNLVDARTLSERYSLPVISFKQSTTLNSGDWSDGHIFTSTSPVLVTLTVTSGANVAGCEFRDVTVTGTLSSSCVLRYAYVVNVSMVGFIFNCALGGIITLLGDTTAMDCWSGIPGTGHPDININDAGDLGVRGFVGGMGIEGSSLPGNNISIDMTGRLHLHSNITAGSLVISGQGVLDNGSSLAIVSNGFLETGKVDDMHKNDGLEQGNPMTVTPTSRSTANGDVDLTLTGDGLTSTTVTRNP